LAETHVVVREMLAARRYLDGWMAILE